MADDHFYTTWPNEREHALASFGYADEGTACYVLPVQQSATLPLYRLLHPGTGDHFYTTSEPERASAAAVHGYIDEGVAAFVYAESAPGRAPFYRLYSPTSGDHCYTTSTSERDLLVGPAIADPGGSPVVSPLLPPGGISLSSPARYADEGIACYVLTAPEGAAVPLYRLRQAAARPALPPRIRGFADLHNHQFANLAFGGRAFVGEAFGPIEQALPHCDFGPEHSLLSPDWRHGPGGVRDVLGALIGLTSGVGSVGHLVGGYPEFDGWPRWNSLTHQSVYEDWLYRAFQGGLRLLVVLAVNNEWVLDQRIVSDVLHLLGWPPTVPAIEKAEGRSGQDMEAVDLQIRAARAMEASIDARSGGPGQGWYRIVTSPTEARAVIAAGKLAVVLGVEVDNLFGHNLSGPSAPATMLAQLEYYYSLGIRHVFPIHFSNNAYGGAGYQNLLTYDAKHDIPTAFPMETQDASAEGYEFHGGRRNTLGLTELGKLLIRALMSKGMIIDIDHMSLAAYQDTVALAGAASYPVISSHTGFVDISRGHKRHESNLTGAQVEQIRQMGGMVALILNQGKQDEIDTWRGQHQTVVEHHLGNTSETWAQAYLYACEQMRGGPVGFGTDFNGMICPTGPRFGPDAGAGGSDVQIGPNNPVQYPFTALASGQEMNRSEVGNRTLTINDDGLAQIGLLPDFIADLQAIGLSDADLDPLLRSAEGYIQLWEKAERNRLAPIEDVRCRALRAVLAERRETVRRKQAEKAAARLPSGKPDLAEIAVIQAEIDELNVEIRDLERERSAIGCF